MKNTMNYVNMILEVAEELGRENEDFDSLMKEGFRFIKEGWTDDDNREVLRANM